MSSNKEAPAAYQPKQYFALLVRRAIDSEAWPLILTDKARALAYPARVSDVYAVTLHEERPTLKT